MLRGFSKSLSKDFWKFASTVFYINFASCHKDRQPEAMLTQPVNLMSSKWQAAHIYQRGFSSLWIPEARSHCNTVSTGYPRLPLIAKLCDFLVSRRPTSSALPNILPAELTAMGWLTAGTVFFCQRYCYYSPCCLVTLLFLQETHCCKT